MSLSGNDYPVWHPFTQMKTAPNPVTIVKGIGAHLFDQDGNDYIDFVSSWWVNLHGHAHPYIAAKIAEQAKQLEHVIFAGFNHPKAIELAHRILKFLPFLNKVFFSDNGSTSVEVALKMAFQFFYNEKIKRNKIIAFHQAYHGDTFGAMAVGERNEFSTAFKELLFNVEFIDVPNELNKKRVIDEFKKLVSKNDVAAFIYEPIVQATAGMYIYDEVTLNELILLAKQNDVICIADEVFTGFGRTGKMFASDYMSNKPDIVCLSKGLTGGFMPLGLTLCSKKIYDAFYSDNKFKALYHGHSYTGNPLACAAACASLDLFQIEKTFEKISNITMQHTQFINKIKNNPNIEAARLMGTILAIDIRSKENKSYFNSLRDELYNFFISKKLLFRPLGNTVYMVPPYCISNQDLAIGYNAIEDFLLYKH